jgi:cytochrome c556
MKFSTKALVTGLFLVAGAAFAADATDPTVNAWQTLMDDQGAAVKVLGEMAGDKVAFDATAAEAAKARLAADAAMIAAKFQTQASDPASKAKPEIWTNWDDYVKKADALTAAATALDATSLDGIKAGMGAIGGACKDCHTAYRM